MEEAGIKGLYATFWHALWVPKGTPKEVVAKLNAAVQAALADPRRSASASPSRARTSRRARSRRLKGSHAHQKAEIDKWWPIIKAAGIKAQ